MRVVNIVPVRLDCALSALTVQGGVNTSARLQPHPADEQTSRTMAARPAMLSCRPSHSIDRTVRANVAGIADMDKGRTSRSVRPSKCEFG